MSIANEPRLKHFRSNFLIAIDFSLIFDYNKIKMKEKIRETKAGWNFSKKALLQSWKSAVVERKKVSLIFAGDTRETTEEKLGVSGVLPPIGGINA